MLRQIRKEPFQHNCVKRQFCLFLIHICTTKNKCRCLVPCNFAQKLRGSLHPIWADKGKGSKNEPSGKYSLLLILYSRDPENASPLTTSKHKTRTSQIFRFISNEFVCCTPLKRRFRRRSSTVFECRISFLSIRYEPPFH